MTCRRCAELHIEQECFECGRKKGWVAKPRHRVVKVWLRNPPVRLDDNGMPVKRPEGPKPLAGGAAAEMELTPDAAGEHPAPSLPVVVSGHEIT